MKEKFVTIDGHKIRYLESGSSDDTLVLIHGLGASAERWDPVIRAFADCFRVVVPDLIGFGYSDKPTADYTPEFFLEFLDKFFISSDINNPDIVGSSLGGQIAAQYASRHSENVRKLVLVSPSGTMKKSTPALDAYITAALYPNESSARNAFEMMDGTGRVIEEKIIEGFIKRMQLPNAKLAFMSTLLGLKNSDPITSRLKAISAPTLIIWGVGDPVIPIRYADGFVSAIKDCKFLRLGRCGHTPYVQDPHIFTSKVLEFLNRV